MTSPSESAKPQVLDPGFLGALFDAYHGEISPSLRRTLAAFSALAVVGALFLARTGAWPARLGAAAILLVLPLIVLLRVVLARRRRRDVRRVIETTVGRADPALGAATLRAVALAERTLVDEGAGSPALAGLHLRRLLSRAPVEEIRQRASGRSTTWSIVGLSLATSALAAVGADPFRVVEGADVLFASENVAPLPLPWLDDVSIAAIPPGYLHEPEEMVDPFVPTALPRGSKLIFRGRPEHLGRRLFVTDGKTEVELVPDGADGVVAHFPLADSAHFRIVAAFGSVRVPQADIQTITSIPDEAPVVRVANAPRSVRTLDEPTITIAYEATDDHGLREVVLSLRAGIREDRRVLSKPSTDARSDKGSYQLSANDPFFRRTYAPVEVRVEARDNDEVTGPKWGKSEATIVVLPQAGEPEALRYAKLLAARDALVDLLDARMSAKVDAKNARSFVRLEQEAQQIVVNRIREAVSAQVGGATPNGIMSALAKGQMARLQKALDAFKQAPSPATHKKLIEQTEDVLLAFDAGVRGLGVRDTKAVAKRLAEVADEAALASGALLVGLDPASATVRLDAAIGILDAGGKQMLKLGDLGLDLGEIVANDLRRIDRARKANDFKHAELAAQDLAARLRRPEPSFGGGGKGGVESGSGGAPSPDPGEASDADQEQAANEQELEELARDHATEMNEVSEALNEAEREAREKLREEAREHAKAIRDAVKNLPQKGRPDSPEAGAAEGRTHAEGMAGDLDGAHLEDAISKGKEAIRSLAEAKRRAEAGSSFFTPDSSQEMESAKQALEGEVAWAEEKLKSLRDAAKSRAKSQLEQSSKDEGALSERAKGLSQKARRGDRALDDDTLRRLDEAEQSMKKAERALKEGNGEEGKKHQEMAQRALEMAQGRKDDDGDRGSQGDKDANEKPAPGKADIPGKDKHKGPEAFRKRVLEGLSGPVDPALKEAVKRYAEGLLK